MEACSICGIVNKAEEPYFTEEYYRVILNDIWFGTINETNLSVDLYLETANKLISKLDSVFGEIPVESDEFNVYAGMVDNCYMFSSAKQYQFIREVKSKEFDVFTEFFDYAESIFKRYYFDYFDAEIDACETQALSAKRWLNIVEWNNE